MNCSPPGSSVHGIFQARILEWVAVPFCRGSSWPRDRPGSPVAPALQADSLMLSHWRSPQESESKVKSFSCVQLFATPWTVAHQAPPSVGFSRQEYWSGLPFPPAGDLPNSGMEPRSPALEAGALTSEPPGEPGKPT